MIDLTRVECELGVYGQSIMEIKGKLVYNVTYTGEDTAETGI